MDNNIDYNEMSFKEIYEFNNQQDKEEGDIPSSSLSEDDAVSMGILQPEQQAPTEPQTDDGNNNKNYKKLHLWDSQVDMAKSVGSEALKILAPKKDGFADKALTKVFGHNEWNEENLWHHEAQTHYAENMQNTYKWVAGIGACLAVPEMGAARIAVAAPKLASFISKAFGTGKWIKTTAQGGLKLQGVKAANAALTGLVGSEVAEFFLRRPEEGEGQFADIFGVSNNPLITALQSDPTDTYWEDKWKAVANGLLVGAAGGVVIERVAIPLAKNLGGMVNGIRKWVNSKNNKEAMESFREAMNCKNNLDNLTDTTSLYNKVQELRNQALETGEDVDELLLKNFNNENIDNARAFNKMLDEGHEPFIREDGTWDLAVSKYDEAHLVSEESYIEQRGVNGAIKDMDDAVKHTWTNRDGLIGTGKTALTKDDGSVNLPVAKKIVNHYKDTWGLDNKINVEVVENLKDPSGKAVQGRTEMAKTQGKGKDKQTKNITIKIDANCKNPHAVLRSELEHARDYAVGNKLGTKGEKHSFPRYDDVETEDALAVKYVRKKSAGKARALNPEETPVKNVQSEVKSPTENVKPQTTGEQLKIDFSSYKSGQEVLEGIKSGAVKIASKEDVSAVVEKIAPEIKGYTWEDIAKGTDEYCSLLNSVMKNNKDLKKIVESIAIDGDVKTLDQFTVKGLALTKVLGSLLDRVNVDAVKMTTADKDALLTSIDHINDYLKSMGSAKGRSLQAQKLINEGKQTFGTKGLSAMTQEGIKSFSDMVAKALEEVTGMNFTTSQALEAVTNKLMQAGDDNSLAIINSISRKKNWMSKYREIVEKGCKEKMTTEEISQKISEMLTDERLSEIVRFASLAPDKVGKFEAITKSGVSYYITNLLSGTSTVFKNAFSGLLNSGLFPMYKIMASGLGAGEDAKLLASEGWNTYKSMWKSMKEAWGLAGKAFIDGEGKFSNIKALSEDTADTLKLQMTNLLDKNNSFGQNFWNFYSVMSRAMMASDEFIQQMNYRAIARGKVTAQCEELMKNGLLKESEFDDMVENLLQSQYYYENGMAKDMDILWETRQMTYQNNLDGTVTNPKTGDKYQMRTPSQLMKIAGDINNAVNQNAVLKGAFPFMRTAANIVQQQLDSNALYATGKWTAERLDKTGFLGFFKKETLESLFEQSPEAAMARARVAMGTISLMTGMTAAAGGFITGSPPIDKNERKALFATGWRPYSINVGGQYYSYQGIEPIQGWLSFSADIHNMLSLTSEDDTEAQEVLMKAFGMGYAAVVDSFLNKASFKTGINQLNSLVENPTEYFQSVARGLLPLDGLVTNISSTGDRNGTKPSTPMEVIANKYFNRGLGDYRRDVFGNRQDLCGLVLVGDKAPNLYRDNPEYVELFRLMKGGYNPHQISKTIAQGGVKYTDFRNPETNRTAYDYMLEEMSSIAIGGQTLQMAVRDLISTDYYKEAPDNAEAGEESKRTLLNEIFTEYAFEAEDRVKNQGALFINKRTGQTLDVVEDEEQLKALQQSTQQQLNDNITNQILKFGQ